MDDDIRRPRNPNIAEGQNQKPAQTNTEYNATPISLEAPHLYNHEEGFTTAKALHKPRGFRNPFKSFKHASKKQKIIGGVIIAVLLLGGGGGVYALHKHFNKKAPAAPAAQKEETPPAPTTQASRLTGEQISPELNQRPIKAIMIENSPDARPQSGLKDAGVVYEAIAEGGITRFMALFQETQPDYIGPVRSVRPYYVSLLLPYDASIVHAGGSAEGLAKVRDMGVKDIDHGANAGAFRRVNDRYAPHNLYTSTADLDQVSAQRGYSSPNAKSLPRKAEAPGATVTARAIDLNISSPLYNVHYDYDQASNTYKRVLGGRPHTDQRSGQQLSPKIVIALTASYSQNGIYSVYQTVGSGPVSIFQDGIVKQGTWHRASEQEQFSFKDEAGQPLTLNTGQTWISLVKAPNAVTYTP